MLAVALCLFLLLLGSLELGYLVGKRSKDDTQDAALSPIEGAVFALLGLILAFAFSASAGRFDARRALAVEELNAIGTAYLRVDLLPAPDQPAVRELFRKYVDSRIEFDHELSTEATATGAQRQSEELQGQIWSAVLSTTLKAENKVLVINALNEMFDAATSRRVAVRNHTPLLIMVLLMVLSVLSAALAGRATARRSTRSWIHRLVFAAMITSTVFVIADLDNPRKGLIRFEYTTQALQETRNSMR